ncbi:MAG TPA: tyrosine-type recombinase/integrase [Gemmatimonadales bacterium]|nr:tyrosine-type recombinase/integrase [Gemmatimonadales bacterium]
MSRHRTMVALAAEYLAARRALGFALRIEGQQLLTFARYADRGGHRGPLTTALAVRWATRSPVASPIGRARRLDTVRPFARYLAATEPRTEIPPTRLLGPSHRRLPPHVYSSEEIRALLRAAAALPPVGGLRPLTYATLFGLLACTGLRISEALRLARSDVDLAARVLTVRETKFRKTRLVPLHPSASRALGRYAAQRDRVHPRPAWPRFFLSEAGTPLAYSTVRTVFLRLRQALGWCRAGERPPRIHDVRHTFACHRLQRWYQDGADVEQHLVALSTYLGHAKVSDTYWYLTGTPTLLGTTAARFERFVRCGEGVQP